MPEDLNRARDLFLHAVGRLAPTEWDAYVTQACGGDSELERQARELLRLHQEAGSFLNRPAAGLGATAAVPLASASETAAVLPRKCAGTAIGPYKLLQQIGEGGMGTVFMAEQTQPVQRKVALKVIKAGMDSRQVVARFEAERQALAMMDHVNIARVFDAGATEAGRPYFVMELVHGVPITRYCDDNRLTPRERLELFVPVCQAIQHAHQKGIIHRDIKPTNVMITLYDGKPVPKVIDFGVAKAIEQKLTERTLFTQYGTMVGTLEYMSPEQAEMSALGADTRSDIFSLGVLLYELLTGSTPLTHKRLKEAAYGEILRMIREEEAPKPSTRLSDSGEALASISAQRHMEPAKLTKLMRGELDWIVMKCLEKDRNRRYETANGLAADVQHYLADEAVQACPPSKLYHFRKFARRNKRAVAMVTVVLMAVLVAATTLGWSVRDRAAREQDIAQETARQLNLTEQGIRQALDRGTMSRAELHVLLKRPGGVQQLLNQPARWELLIRTTQGELAQARQLAVRAEGSLDAEWNQAIDMLEQQLTSDQADYDLALRLEKIRADRATWVEGRFDHRKAADEYPKAFAGLAVLNEDPAAVAARLSSSPIKDQLVAALDDWASVAFLSRKEGLAEQILAVARQAAPDPAWGDRLRQRNVWDDQEALGKLVAEAPAAGLSPQILDLVGLLLRDVDSPLNEAWLRQAQAQHPADFWLSFNLGAALHNTNPVEAAGLYRVALAVRPGNGVTYNNLGAVLYAQKKLDEAIACYRRSIELDPKYANSHSNLGAALYAQKKLDEAIACYRRSIELDPKFPAVRINLGDALAAQGKLDEAIASYRTAIELDPKLAAAHNNLGTALSDQQKLDEAIACYRKAIELDPKRATAHYNLGLALMAQRTLDEAIASFRKAIELDPKYATAHYNLGNALKAQGKLDEAIACYRRAIELDPNIAMAHHNLGVALAGQKKLDEAIACYHKAIEIDPKVAGVHHDLGAALAGQKKLDEAIACFRKAIELDPKLVNAHNKLGLALYLQGKLDEAIACYRTAIELDPKLAAAHNNLGTALSDQQKLDEAIAAYRKAIELNPKDAAAHHNLSDTLARKGWDLVNCPDPKLRDPKRAVEASTEAVELAPQSVEAWQNLGWVQYRAGNWKASIEALEKSCKLEKGGDCGQWIVMALAHWKLANEKELPEQERDRHKTEARRLYDQAVKQIDSSGAGGDPVTQAIRAFRAEAAELLGVKEKQK